MSTGKLRAIYLLLIAIFAVGFAPTAALAAPPAPLPAQHLPPPVAARPVRAAAAPTVAPHVAAPIPRVVPLRKPDPVAPPKRGILAVLKGTAAVLKASVGGVPERFTTQALHAHIAREGTPPRDFTLVVEHAGVTREAVVHLPPNYDPKKPAPMVMNFHGVVMNAPMLETYSGMNEAADKQGFIAVHPQGTVGRSGTRSWNAGRCCGEAQLNHVDDVGFVDALLTQLDGTIHMDGRRVFATGFSNGGMLTYTLARQLPNRFAAIAPVSAVDLENGPMPGRPVPIFHVHGTADRVVGFRAGNAVSARLLRWPLDAIQSTDKWSAHNGGAASTEAVAHDGRTTDKVWRNAAGDVMMRFRTVQNGGHAWPGDGPTQLTGSQDARTTHTHDILDFLAKHSLPAPGPAPSPEQPAATKTPATKTPAAQAAQVAQHM